MAEKIYIADKKTLDEVNKNSNIIKENTEFVKKQFPISSGIDWSKYELIGGSFSGGTDKWEEVVTINGVGYLSAVLVKDTSDAYVKIYIDDILKVDMFIKSNNYGGFSVFPLVNLQEIGIFTSLPYKTKSIGGDIAPIFASHPLFFKSKLNIKVKGLHTNLKCKWSGGIKA